MPTEQVKAAGAHRPSKYGRRWLWFAAGFLIVFVTLAVTITAYPMTRRGDAVEVRRLWEYYLIEARRAVGSSNTMGPASGSAGAAATMLFQHVLFSAAGGGFILVVRWVLPKVRGRTSASGGAPDPRPPQP